MTPIGYTSEKPAEWALLIAGTESLGDLRRLCEEWIEIAPDALRCANSMTADEFKAFKVGLKKEQRGIFAGEVFAEKYSDIMMPAIMFKVSIKAVEFKVPWGLMYLRLKEAGKLPQDTKD